MVAGDPACAWAEIRKGELMLDLGFLYDDSL